MSSFCIKGSKVPPVICPISAPTVSSELVQVVTNVTCACTRWRDTGSQTRACGEQRLVLCCLVLLWHYLLRLGPSLNLELTDLADLLASVFPGSSCPYLPLLVLQAHTATPGLLTWVQPGSGHCDHTACTLPTGPSPNLSLSSPLTHSPSYSSFSSHLLMATQPFPFHSYRNTTVNTGMWVVNWSVISFASYL